MQLWGRKESKSRLPNGVWQTTTQCSTARTWGCTAELTWLVRTLVLSTVQSARYILITTKKKKKIFIAFITLSYPNPIWRVFFCENGANWNLETCHRPRHRRLRRPQILLIGGRLKPLAMVTQLLWMITLSKVNDIYVILLTGFINQFQTYQSDFFVFILPEIISLIGWKFSICSFRIDYWIRWIE